MTQEAESENYSIDFSEDFDEWETIVEAKGWLSVQLNMAGKRYELMFFDPVRLGQSISDDLKQSRVFFEKNLVVIPSVTRSNVEAAVARLVWRGALNEMAGSSGDG